MKKEMIIKNIYSINGYNTRDYIENNQDKINQLLEKDYSVKNVTVAATDLGFQSQNIRSHAVFVEIYVLEKVINL